MTKALFALRYWIAAIFGLGFVVLAFVITYAVAQAATRQAQEVQILESFTRGVLSRMDSGLWKADTAIEDFGKFEKVMSAQLTQVRVQVKQSSDVASHDTKIQQAAVAKAITQTAAAVVAVTEKTEPAPIVRVEPAPAAAAPVVHVVTLPADKPAAAPAAPAPPPEKTPWLLKSWHWVKKPFVR